MWLPFITTLVPRFGEDGQVRLMEPTSAAAIRAAEQQLGLTFPEELVALLCESNGFYALSHGSFVWPIENVVKQNQAFRTHDSFREMYMPFDHMLFIGDDGGGNQYFYPIVAGAIRKQDIYFWNHENDSREWYAAHLKQFLKEIVSG